MAKFAESRRERFAACGFGFRADKRNAIRQLLHRITRIRHHYDPAGTLIRLLPRFSKHSFHRLYASRA